MRLTLDEIVAGLGGPHPPTPSPSQGEGESEQTVLHGALSSPTPPRLAKERGRGGEVSFTGVSTDTRTLQAGDLFVALVNANADGHRFVPQALAAGAAGLVVSTLVEAPDDIPVVRVPDTQVAYGQIARAWRDKFDIPIVGVTGSVGKTTTKEMLAAALSPLGPVLKTAASQNNETGVPKALLYLNEAHKAAVIEMGMRGSGQIEYLCDIARPTVGVITVIGENHIELLGSLDAIADAKSELLASLPADGVAAVNADDPYAQHLIGKTAARVITFGVTAEADYHACDLAPTDDGWSFSVRGVRVEIASPSRHDIGNALAALAVAETLGVGLPAAAHALAGYTPPDMRMQVLRTPAGTIVLNDAYNAAPVSVRSALETLTAMRPGQGRRIAFLGDMKELGAHGPQAHWDLGNVIAALGGLHALYTVGALAAQIPGATEYFPDSAAAALYAERSLALQPDDIVLIKGSRAMAMEQVVEALIGKPKSQEDRRG